MLRSPFLVAAFWFSAACVLTSTSHAVADSSSSDVVNSVERSKRTAADFTQADLSHAERTQAKRTQADFDQSMDYNIEVEYGTDVENETGVESDNELGFTSEAKTATKVESGIELDSESRSDFQSDRNSLAATDTSASDARTPDSVQSPSDQRSPADGPSGAFGPLEEWIGPNRLGTSLKVVLTMSVLSLAPAILLMTTSYIRITVVLSLLRHAFGAQQLPPQQVTTSIALFMTLLIMWPVWNKVYEGSVKPYSDPEIEMSWEEAWSAGVQPIHRFMSSQIDRWDNGADVFLFMRHMPEGTPEPKDFDDVPLQVLLPAFVLSELKTAFLIGFKIYLPFLVLDVVVATITMSMGMVMLPPTVLALPLKLLVFVLVDGWHLVIGMLMDSFILQSY